MKKFNYFRLVLALLFMNPLISVSQAMQKSVKRTHIKSNSDLPVKVDDFKKVEFFALQKNNNAEVKSNTKSYAEQIKNLSDSLIKTSRKKIEFNCLAPEKSNFVLGDLNVIDEQAFDVTKSAGVNLSLFGVTGSLGKKETLIKKNFYVYRDFPCSDGTATRILIGMAMYIHIKDLKGNVSANLSNVSAAVQLGRGNAEYRLQIFGVTQNFDFKSLPSTGSLNVDNYSKILAAWDNVKSQFAKDFEVDPIIIPNVVATTVNVNP